MTAVVPDDVVERLKAFSDESPAAILHVKILRGHGLYKTDTLHEIDPYVVVSLGSDSGRSVALLRGGSDCAFDFSVSFPFVPDKDIPDGLVVAVWDQDLGNRDDEVGRCSVPLASFREHETKARKFVGQVTLRHTSRLSGRKKAGGSLDVEIYWEKNSSFLESADDSLKGFFRSSVGEVRAVPVPINYCVANFNRLGGVARKIMEKGKCRKYSPFRTYRLRLWHVPYVFGRYTKGWNRGYKAAQKIYGNGMSSKSVRATLRIQNFMSYSNDYVNHDFETHEVSSLASLRAMLRSYRAASGAPRPHPRYTYVVMPDSYMHFSVTSKNVATDFLSKHALHAGAATEVVYSGEFFFDERSERAREAGGGGARHRQQFGDVRPAEGEAGPAEAFDAPQLWHGDACSGAGQGGPALEGVERSEWRRVKNADWRRNLQHLNLRVGLWITTFLAKAISFPLSCNRGDIPAF